MRRWLYPLLLLVAFTSSPAQAAWREAKSSHFVIYSEQSAASLQKFAESLERYDKGLRILFRLQDGQVSHASRVTIFILPNIDAVKRAAGARSSSSIAGFYRDWPQGPVAFVPRSTGGGEDFGFDSTLVLQHEYAHHFLMQNFTSVFPAWFNEGFAEFASTAARSREGGLSLGMPAQHRAYTLLLESALPIEKLLGSGAMERDNDIAKFYGRAWLLCHYLFVTPDRRAQLPAYLAQVNSGKPSLEAARAAFGDLVQLNKDLDGYLRRIQSRMTGFTLPPAALPIAPVSVRDVTAGEAAMIDVRVQSKAGVDAKEAAAVVAQARKAATPFATDAAVQTALAEAEFDAGNYVEAEAAADRAIAADPKAIDALTYKGAARMRQLMLSAKPDPAGWAEARKWFLAANRLDPDDPEPLTYFFMSFIRQGIEPTPNAAAAAVRALDLAPQATGLRVIMIQYLLNHGKTAEARTSLLRLASSPHGDELRDAAGEVLAILDKDGTDAALLLLRNRAQAKSGQAASDGGGH